MSAISGALFGGILLSLTTPTVRPGEAVDRTHPVRVALREVLVDGDDGALTRERVQMAASVDISVLPSPVRASAMRPSLSVRPPMSARRSGAS